MFDIFDPYEMWLGIPKGDQPANYYRLLGVELDARPEEIERNWEERMAVVKRRAVGKRAAISQQILNELSRAKVTLLDERERTRYDEELRQAVEKTRHERELQRSERKRSRFKGGDEFTPPPVAPPRATEFTSQELEGHGDDVIRAKKREPIDSEIDMTPMADCTFLLLIFFMVTASFGMQKAEQVAPPREPGAGATAVEASPENAGEYITVRIDSKNYYHVQIGEEFREEPSKQGMIVLLQEAKAQGVNGVVPTRLRIIAHGDASHERFVAAIDAGIAVGMEEIKSEITESDEAE
jgi:biopolymer transport protein ExbD